MNSPHLTRGFARKISRSLANCELLHIERQPFDLTQASSQHDSYVAALEAAGVQMTVLPEEPDLPDATFIEDTVILLDELAVLCRLGAASREPEAAKIAAEIASVRPVRRLHAPATIEGGDVLRIGKTLFVGLSSRTNREGVRQLEEMVLPFDYRVIPVHVHGCLHLKTGATSPSPGLLLANPDWMDCSPFRDFEILRVPPGEPWGANTLPVNETVLVSITSPRTAGLLESRGLRVQRLDISELQKAEAGLTCLSVLFTAAFG
jgi:dimethylargininase